MKTLILVSLLSLLMFPTICSFAQENQESTDKLLYLQKVEKYRKMKNGGATLTVLGGILFVVGTVKIYNSLDLYSNDSGNAEAGAVAFLFGVAGLGSGIPLWIVGAHNQRKYKAKLESITIQPTISARGTGLTLTYRF